MLIAGSLATTFLNDLSTIRPVSNTTINPIPLNLPTCSALTNRPYLIDMIIIGASADSPKYSNVNNDHINNSLLLLQDTMFLKNILIF